MLKNISKLECKAGDRLYQLLCDSDSPISELKEVLFQFTKYLGQLEDSIKANQPVENVQVEEEPVKE